MRTLMLIPVIAALGATTAFASPPAKPASTTKSATTKAATKAPKPDKAASAKPGS